jgi:hypothetical protein
MAEGEQKTGERERVDGNDHHIRLLFESAVRQGLIAGTQDDVGFHLDAEFLAHVDLGSARRILRP